MAVRLFSLLNVVVSLTASAAREVANPYTLLEASGTLPPVSSGSAAFVSGTFCSTTKAGSTKKHQFLVATTDGNVTVLDAEWTPFTSAAYPGLLKSACHPSPLSSSGSGPIVDVLSGGASAKAGQVSLGVTCADQRHALVLLEWDGPCGSAPHMRVVSAASLAPPSASSVGVLGGSSWALTSLATVPSTDVLLACVSQQAAAFIVAINASNAASTLARLNVSHLADAAVGAWSLVPASREQIGAVWSPSSISTSAAVTVAASTAAISVAAAERGVGISISLASSLRSMAVEAGPLPVPLPPGGLVGGVVLREAYSSLASTHAMLLVGAHGTVLPLAFGCGPTCLAQPSFLTPLVPLPVDLTPVRASGVGPGLEPHATTAAISPGVGTSFRRSIVAVTAARDSGRFAILRGPPLGAPAVSGATDLFPVSILVFGQPSDIAERRAALSNLHGQMGLKATFNASAGSARGLKPPLNVSALKEMLSQTNSNAYDFVVCDCTPTPDFIDCSPLQTYAQFISLLEGTRAPPATPHLNMPLRIWLELMPPTEAAGGKCLPPTDDPRTPWNETSLFSPELGYLDYAAWADLAGKLAGRYPQLTAVNVDDFSHDAGIGQPFPPDLVARMTSAMRAQGAPWMGLTTCMYYSQDDTFSYGLWPDLPMVVDGLTFAFRNELQGSGPCTCDTPERQCPWGPRQKECPKSLGAGGCLAGACADSTVLNAPLEVAHMSTRLPAGRPMIFCFYATGHSSLGQPTAAYVAALLDMANHLPAVDGVMVYTIKATPAANVECKGLSPPLYGGEMGCIVRAAFQRMRGDFL
jgi:hypothetical protein